MSADWEIFWVAIQDVCCVVVCSECMDLLRELDAPVKYIVLPSHAYEHKVLGAACLN